MEEIISSDFLAERGRKHFFFFQRARVGWVLFTSRDPEERTNGTKEAAQRGETGEEGGGRRRVELTR